MASNIKSPIVTVLMFMYFVYNGERYFRQVVDSILNQTFKDFELIIVNESSTNGISESLRERGLYSKYYFRFPSLFFEIISFS